MVLQRIFTLISMGVDALFEGVEDQIPLERKLAQARKERKKLLAGGIDDASKMGALVEALVVERAEYLAMLEDTTADLNIILQDARAAQARGEVEDELALNADAQRLAAEAAQIQSEIDELDQDIDEASANFKQARGIIVQMSRDLKQAARGDVRLVAKVARTDLKERMLSLQENILGLTTAEDSAEGMRQRAITKAGEKERYIDARAQVIGDLWDEHRKGRIAESRRLAGQGAVILEAQQKALGYTPSTPAALPAPKPEAEKVS